jgi:hypothetical protein
MATPTIIISHRVRLEIYPTECYPEDPGSGTPCMVFLLTRGCEFAATFGCAMDTGEVEDIQLSAGELARMQAAIPAINAALGRDWYL